MWRGICWAGDRARRAKGNSRTAAAELSGIRDVRRRKIVPSGAGPIVRSARHGSGRLASRDSTDRASPERRVPQRYEARMTEQKGAGSSQSIRLTIPFRLISVGTLFARVMTCPSFHGPADQNEPRRDAGAQNNSGAAE